MLLRTGMAIILAALLVAPDARAADGGTVAVVNGQEISREEFGLTLVDALGRAAMESMVDRMLIEQEARRQGIAVTDEELAARRQLELELGMRAVRERVRMGPEEFRLASEQYGWDADAIRDELAEGISESPLRVQILAEKLLAPQMELSEDALRAYYERSRGRRYSAAHIVVAQRSQAEGLLATLQGNPDLWAEAVLQASLDRASTPHKGRIGPVPSSSEFGRALAGMKPEELKLHDDGQYWHVLRFIKEIPPAEEPFEQVREQLRAELVARTARQQFDVLLARLNADACVVVNLTSDPSDRRVLGEGVAGFVNGEPLLIDDLAEALIEEFGPVMLEPYIERTLILQEAERRGVSVSAEDITARKLSVADQLFQEQALARGITADQLTMSLEANGVDVQQFKELLVQESTPLPSIRATLLAEKLVADDVEVTEADIREAYTDLSGERLVVREAEADTHAAAQGMLQQVRQGASFDQVALTESAEPGLWMERGRALNVTASHPYYPYAKDLREGETSRVFEHAGKYRIIKLLKRHSPPEPPSLDSVRASVEQEAFLRKARKRSRALLLKLRAEATIEVKLK